MTVPVWVWAATLVGLTLILVLDLVIIGRRPHEPKMAESARWVCFYVALALVFAGGIYYFSGGVFAGQFVAGWLTEYSLSVDNLFIFVIIMGRFAVPRQYQQRVLLIGIVLALILRGIFIAAGAALISQFVAVFYIFGAFLIYTAVKLWKQGEPDESDYHESALIKRMRRILPLSTKYNGAKLTVRDKKSHKLLFTPLFIVMLAIGTTDLIFALDSIPAIFGLTTEPYLVFTANVFALMGLRQLYFLLGGLLNRLQYLSYGLAIVLAFIGVKLVLEALHSNNLPFLNNGEGFSWAPEIPIWFSLGFILVTLIVTTVLSLMQTRRDLKTAAAANETS